jgi:hypothetical protein
MNNTGFISHLSSLISHLSSLISHLSSLISHLSSHADLMYWSRLLVRLLQCTRSYTVEEGRLDGSGRRFPRELTACPCDGPTRGEREFGDTSLLPYFLTSLPFYFVLRSAFCVLPSALKLDKTRHLIQYIQEYTPIF